MVYPHSNDIGKEKPEPPKSSNTMAAMDSLLSEVYSDSLAKSYEDFAKAFDSMKFHGLGAPNGFIQPSGNKAGKTTHAQAKSDLYAMLYGKNPYGHSEIYGEPPKDPVLIDGPKGNYTYFDNEPSLPTSIHFKRMSIDMKVDGIGLKEKRLGVQFPMPEHEVTESQLRAMLKQQFLAFENLIVNNLKKEKGIK